MTQRLDKSMRGRAAHFGLCINLVWISTNQWLGDFAFIFDSRILLIIPNTSQTTRNVKLLHLPSDVNSLYLAFRAFLWVCVLSVHQSMLV